MTCGSGQCCPSPFSCWLRSSSGGAAVSRPRPEARFRGFNISAAMRFCCSCFTLRLFLVTTSAAKLLEDQKPEARIHGCMTLTVKKNFGPDLLLKVLMLNMHKIWSFDSQIVATRCQILRLKCTKFDFGWGSTPDPAGGLTVLLQTP